MVAAMASTGLSLGNVHLVQRRLQILRQLSGIVVADLPHQSTVVPLLARICRSLEVGNVP